MCTLLSFNMDTYCRNYSEITEQLIQDGRWNNDGASMLTDSGILIRSIEQGDGVDSILDALDTMRWDRVWIHLRSATTGYLGLDGCHGFDGGRGVFVFHNGILSSKLAKDYQVDSELIAKATEKLGVDRAASWLLRNEGYANVFLVDTQEGEYHVVRSKTGTLFTDGCGNYSSNAIKGIIDVPVAQKSIETHEFTEPMRRLPRAFKFG